MTISTGIEYISWWKFTFLLPPACVPIKHFACIASRMGNFRDSTMLYVCAFTWNCVHANMYNIYSAQSQVIRGLYVHIVVLYSQPTRST